MSEFFEKGDVVFHKASGQRAVVSKIYHKYIGCSSEGEQEDIYDIETGFGEIVEFVDGFKLEKQRKQTEIILPASGFVFVDNTESDYVRSGRGPRQLGAYDG